MMEYAARLNTKPSCVACRRIHKKKGRQPPCDECLPQLGDKYSDVISIFDICQGQLIVGPGGVVDLNLATVMEIMKLRDIPEHDRWWVLREVHKLYTEVEKGRAARQQQEDIGV